jgi:hypothetical protein
MNGTNRRSPCVLLPVLTLLGLLLPTPGAAQSTYRIQPIVTVGDTVGNVQIGGAPRIGTLNDKGQLLFTVPNRAGGSALLLSAEGNSFPLVVGGQNAPGGTWPRDVSFTGVGTMNQRGDVVFRAPLTTEENTSWGVFLWDAQTHQVTPVARVGMLAVNCQMFQPGNAAVRPWINNRGEIAFAGCARDAAGKSQPSAFFLANGGELLAVALPDQAVPGDDALIQFQGTVSLNDAGMIAFRAHRQGDPTLGCSGYVWEHGTLTPVALVGMEGPGGGRITGVSGLWVNNKNRTVLLTAHLSSAPNQAGLYRLVDGRLVPVAVPGQEMPGGGTLRTVLETNGDDIGGPNALSDVSPANEAGQHAFNARLEGGSVALYQVDADGKLALLLKEGDATELGSISRIREGSGIGLNSKGQVSLVVRIAHGTVTSGGPETLVLLTPPRTP